VIEVTVTWARELNSTHADVVECLVVDTEGLIGVLDELMDGEGGIVGFENGVRNFWRGHHRNAFRLLIQALDHLRHPWL
jgi:hypothetical protein